VLVASLSSDQTFRLWNVATAEEVAILPLAGRGISLALDPMRPRAACGDTAGNVYLLEFQAQDA
jgi:hypothetical protein